MASPVSKAPWRSPGRRGSARPPRARRARGRAAPLEASNVGLPPSGRGGPTFVASGGPHRAIAGVARRVRCREWPRSTPGSARWARAWSTTPSSSSGRGRRRRSASPCACAAPSTSWPTRATACAARGCPRAPATTTGSCSTASRFPDPASRWQPNGLRGPSRVVDPGAFAWTDRRFRAAPLRDAVLYELHVGTFTAEGTFDGRRGPAAGAGRAGRHPRRAHARRRVPRPPRLGLRRRLPLGRPLGLRRPARPGAPRRRRPRRRPGRRPRRRLQPRRRERREGARGLRAVTSPSATRRRGARPSTSTARAPTASANGCCRARPAGCATSTSTACASTRSTPSTTTAPATCWPSWPSASARRTAARWSSPRAASTTRRSSARCARAATATTPSGPTTSTTPCARCSPASARAGTRSSARWPSWPRPIHRPHVHDGAYSTFRGRRFGARADDRAPEQFVVFDQNHDQVGNRAFGDRLPASGATAGRVLHAAGTLHPHAVHGRGARRARSLSVLLRSHRQAHGRRDARGPPPGVRRLRRVRRARRSPIRRTRPPSSAPSSRAAGARSCASCTPRCCARAARCRPGWTASSSPRTTAGCACTAAPSSWRATSRRAARTVPVRGAHGGARHPQRDRWATAACACPRARER